MLGIHNQSQQPTQTDDIESNNLPRDSQNTSSASAENFSNWGSEIDWTRLMFRIDINTTKNFRNDKMRVAAIAGLGCLFLLSDKENLKGNQKYVPWGIASYALLSGSFAISALLSHMKLRSIQSEQQQMFEPQPFTEEERQIDESTPLLRYPSHSRINKFASTIKTSLPTLPRDVQTLPIQELLVLYKKTAEHGISLAKINNNIDPVLIDRANYWFHNFLSNNSNVKNVTKLYKALSLISHPDRTGNCIESQSCFILAQTLKKVILQRIINT